MTIEELFKSLTHHPPSDEQIVKIEEFREAARDFAVALFQFVPEGRKRSIAITSLEESTMWAVKAIVLDS